jgi:DNA repair exonuclease SbcCD ATPase subunit
MRLVAIDVEGFRAFARRQQIDLDASSIVLFGTNGQGKTSLFDAILWALSGSVPRLGEDPSRIVSMYSESGQARVSLEFRAPTGELYHLVRRYDGQEQQIRLEYSGQALAGSSAQARLLEVLWPTALAAPDAFGTLTAAITRSVYLQQDLVRKFIETDSDQERFSAVSELVGAGRVTELQLALDRARAPWTRITNARSAEAEPLRQRIAALEAQEAELSRVIGVEAAPSRAWAAWWAALQRFEIVVDDVPIMESSEAPQRLDLALKQLETTRRMIERRYSGILALASEIATQALSPPPDPAPTKQALEAIELQLRAAREALTEAQNRAAQERRVQVERHELREELRSLATLALRHLGDHCPVCAQTYDEPSTRRRLEELATSAEPAIESVAPVTQEVATRATAVENLERSRADLAVRFRREDEAARDYTAWRSDRDRRLREFGVDTSESTVSDPLQAVARDLEATVKSVREHHTQGERLALTLARAAQRARHAEVQRELASARSQLQQLEAVVHAREETGLLANRILEALREASTEVVESRLDQIQPLLLRIYARIDPHPSFRSIRFLTTVTRGRGRLVTSISDPLAQLSTDSPETVLSSSQMNALAVSVFLTFNLGMPSLPLQTAMLDDPLQSLDDINLLGLIDLLRRTKEKRQLLISTHDVRFAQLLARKLRPVADGERTIFVECSGWGREGPTVTPQEIRPDLRRLRIAS